MNHFINKAFNILYQSKAKNRTDQIKALFIVFAMVFTVISIGTLLLIAK